MGGALAWHQSQLRIGCCPGNGTSDLIYPLAHPSQYVHSALTHVQFFCGTLSRHPSLCESWNSSSCALFLPSSHFFFTSVASSTQSR